MTTKKLTLHYPPSKTNEALVYRAMQRYHLQISILRAKIAPEEGGHLSLLFTGEEKDINRAITYLRRLKVNVHSKGLIWDEQVCAHCGACLVHCPSRALAFADRATRQVVFTEDNCIECLSCIKACPFGACSTGF